MLIGLARCGIREDDDDTSARFFGGLNRDIQNILDYKDRLVFPNCTILLLRQNGKYRDAALSYILSGPTLGDRFSSVPMLRSPRRLLLSHQQHHHLLRPLLR